MSCRRPRRRSRRVSGRNAQERSAATVHGITCRRHTVLPDDSINITPHLSWVILIHSRWQEHIKHARGPGPLRPGLVSLRDDVLRFDDVHYVQLLVLASQEEDPPLVFDPKSYRDVDGITCYGIQHYRKLITDLY